MIAQENVAWMYENDIGVTYPTFPNTDSQSTHQGPGEDKPTKTEEASKEEQLRLKEIEEARERERYSKALLWYTYVLNNKRIP